MIPKRIHYCWFGGKNKPDDVLRMIESWRRYCHDYTIKEWNETNFDIHAYRYCEEAYSRQKWAFVSDVARLWAIVHEGGIYLDTDVEVLRPLDALLCHKAFIGFEGTEWVGTNIIGSVAGHPLFAQFLSSYEKRKFINPDGTMEQTTNVTALTRLLETSYGLVRNGCRQSVADIEIYPTDHFCPYDYINGKIRKTENTYTIHWYQQSWIRQCRLKTLLSRFFHRLNGKKMK